MVPRFGATCILQDGSQDGSTSKRGLIDLNTGSGDACSDSAGGISDLKKNVLNGSGATCSIGDTISPQSGQGASELNAVRDLLAGKGTPPVVDGTDCDVKFRTAHPGIDDFAEALERTDGGPPGPSPDAVYQLRACKSPRLIDIVVIGNFATDLTIKAFAGFYILGCKSDTDLTLPKDMPPNKCDTNIPPGHAQILGIFFQKLDLGGDTGEFNEFGDNSITLTE